MSANPRILLGICLFALLGAGVARAQDGAETGAPRDSLVAAILAGAAAAGDTLTPAQVDSILAAADNQPASIAIPTESLGLHPVFKSETRAQDTRVEVNNDLSLGVAYPSSWTVGGRIFYNRTLPRELSKEGLRTGFSLNTGKRLLGALPLQISADRSYTLDEQNKGLASYRRDVNEQQRVGVTVSGGRKFLPWLSANLSTGAGASAATASNNQSLDRSSQDLNRQLAGHLDLAPAQGLTLVAGYSGQGLLSSASLNEIQDDIHTGQDSLQLRMEYKPSAMLSINAKGGRLSRLAESLDFKRNEYGVVDPDSLPVLDEIRDTGVGGQINLDFKPWRRLSFSGSFRAQSEERRVKLNQDKNKDNESSEFQLLAAVKLWPGLDADASYKQGEIHSLDFTADKRQLKREFLTEARQALSKSFVLSGEAFLLLTQDLYDDGKQDRDKAQTRFSLTIAGDATPWLGASSTLQWFQNQDVLIPSTNSIASKDRNSLSWKADLDYTFRGRYRVSQRCEVSVTEEDFYFTRDKNALSRDYLLLTSSKIPMGAGVDLNFEHEFRKRETGSYLPDLAAPGSPKTFFKDSRTKTELLRLGISHTYREYMRVACDEEIGRDVDYDYADQSQQLSIYGTLNFSMRFSQTFGSGGSLDATLAHRARFGSFVRENQRSLWLPTLSIGYTF